MHAVANRMTQSQTSQARCPRITGLLHRSLMELHYTRLELTNRDFPTTTTAVNHTNTCCTSLETHLVQPVSKGQAQPTIAVTFTMTALQFDASNRLSVTYTLSSL